MVKKTKKKQRTRNNETIQTDVLKYNLFSASPPPINIQIILGSNQYKQPSGFFYHMIAL